MANPRTSVRFTEIGYNAATFLRLAGGTGAIDFLQSVSNPYPASTSTQLGYSASTIADKTVRVGQAGDRLLGKIVTVNYDACSVQIHGFAEFSYIAGGSAPVIGSGVVCDGSGGVKVVASTFEYLGGGTICVSLDTVNLIATIKLQ